MELPSLSAVARNNGLLAEGLAAQVSRELGVEVKVLQNASGHGVDLYAFDATMNRYIVIEVKSSTVGNFGSLPAGSAEEFFRTRVDRAASGTGFWKDSNVPKSTIDAAKDIQKNYERNIGSLHAPTVVGYKYEISIPKLGESGAPQLTIKKWGG